MLPFKVADVSNATTTSEGKSETGEGLLLSRVIDWTLALVPTDSERNLIDEAFRYEDLWKRSLNQSCGPYSDCPMFTDIEIKKLLSDRDSRLQIAIWACGGYNKRKLHDWDTGFPMPALTVDGHQWELYIFWGTTENKVV